MSEAKVRWGVTVRINRDTPTRVRVTNSGGPSVYDNRCRAHESASGFGDWQEARLVKLTRRAKGWRPASEPPNHGRDVLGMFHRETMRVVRHVSAADWRLALTGNSTNGVTHWRELPAGLK